MLQGFAYIGKYTESRQERRSYNREPRTLNRERILRHVRINPLGSGVDPAADVLDLAVACRAQEE